MVNPQKKLKVLVLTFTPFMSEPRALKQVQRLREEYEITTAGFGAAPFEDITHIELAESPSRRGLFRIPGAYPALLLLRCHHYLANHLPRSVAAYAKLKVSQWDIIIAHDVTTIALANRLSPRLGVLSDLHEYAPRQNEHSFLWRLLIAPYFRWLLRNEVAKALEVTTVSQGIVDAYREEFGLQTTLVVNATPYWETTPRAVESPVKLVHSGIPGKARKLGIMIEGVRDSSANVTLDLYLMHTDPAHLRELKALAGDDPRIKFCEPVAYRDLLSTLHQYDIGVILIPPTTFNLRWGLPNKLFDFVQARLGVIVGPSPEMINLVNRYGFGSITKDFKPSTFSDLLNGLDTETVWQWKLAAHQAAKEVSAERQVEVWAAAVSRIAKPS